MGLRPFEEEDALLFFGRREQTAELLELLNGHHFLGIVGSSGCGKSSLVRAGLIPALLGGFLVDERRRWLFAKLKPGDAPLRQLAKALCGIAGKPADARVESLLAAVHERSTEAIVDEVMPRLGDAANLLLLVDQFEEIFAFRGARDEGLPGRQEVARRRERARRRAEAVLFVDLLLELGERRDLPIYTVLTMRTDFLGDCDIFYGLPEAMNRGRYLVPRLTRGQLREAIEGPARIAGAEVSPRLVERLLHDLGDRADRLPVLQHALLRTWQSWRQAGAAGAMDLPHYRAVGELERALALHAGESLGGLDAGLAARILKCLTDTDPGGRRVRRACHLSELVTASGASSGEVLAVLTRLREEDRHFVYWSDGPDPIVNISHESLIRQWGQLAEWVDEERRDRDRFLELVSRARGELAGDRELLRGRELETVLAWRESVRPTPNWAERYRQAEDDFEIATSYLDRSRDYDEAEVGPLLRLADGARRWSRGEAGLLRGAELQIAQKWLETVRPTAEWAGKHVREQGDFEAAMEYLEASRRESRKERRRRRLAIASAVAGGVAVVFLALAFWWGTRLSAALDAAQAEWERAEAALLEKEQARAELKDAFEETLAERDRTEQARRDTQAALDQLRVEEREKEAALEDAKRARAEAEARYRELVEARELLAAYGLDQESSTLKAEPAADVPPVTRPGREPEAGGGNRVLPDDPHFPEQWNLLENGDGPGRSPGGINLPAAWSRSVGSAEVVVAVLSTGIVARHPDLEGSPNLLGGWDMISVPSIAADGDGRDRDATDPGDGVERNECRRGSPKVPSTWSGSHSAGLVGAGWTNNGLGISGVNWKVSVLPVRVLGRCGGIHEDLTDGILWAAGLPVAGVPANPSPARVILIDAGGTAPCSSLPELQSAIRRAIEAGATVVVPAGNTASNAAGDFPASCAGVIAVAASDYRGHLVTRYSNFGEVVDLLAPGGDLKRDDNEDGEPDAILSLTDDGYKATNGTSGAAAHVAGVAALLLSREPTLSPEEVRQRLMENAIPRTTEQCPKPCGAGLLNADFPPGPE